MLYEENAGMKRKESSGMEKIASMVSLTESSEWAIFEQRDEKEDSKALLRRESNTVVDVDCAGGVGGKRN